MSATNPNPNIFSGSNVQPGFSVAQLFRLVNNATASCNAKLSEIQGSNSSISIGDMFEMQMLMNHLSQLSEMATAVVSSANSAISSMARNVKS